MKKILFLFNPYSGKCNIKENLVDILKIFSKYEYQIEVYPTKAPLDGKKYLVSNGKCYDLIVCSGGDGTLNEVVSGIVEINLDIPLGYIPSGSTNDFGNSIGLSNNMVECAEIIMKNQNRRVDIGTFNDRVFVYIAAFGAFTDISYNTPQKLKNLLGHKAYILNGLKEIVSIHSHRVKITWLDESEKIEKNLEGEFIYGMVTNSFSVGGFNGITGRDIKLDDGLYEVTLIKKISNPSDFKNIIAFLLKTEEKSESIITFKTRKIKFYSKTAIQWTLDGEDGGKTKDVEIKNNERALSIMV